MIHEAIIIGGGPAGLMAANVLESNHINYLLLEKNERPGKKLLLTGGKRCNVTNHYSADQFIAALNMKHRKFLYHVLKSFGPTEIITYFKDHNLELKLEEGYKYFPVTDQSSSVLHAMLEDLDPKKTRTNQSVKKIEKQNDYYIIHTSTDTFETRRVVLATGSNSFPSTGSSGDGIVLIKPFNIDSIPFYPAEAPVYSNEIVENYSDLQGYSISNTRVIINETKKSATGDVLFTHFGLSGPAIMHLSEDIDQELIKSKVHISFSLIGIDRQAFIMILDQAKIKHLKIFQVLESITTKKVAHKLLDVLEIKDVSILEISKKQLNQLVDLATNFTVEIDRVEDKEKAYVNAGGISTKAIDPKTMQIKNVKGLYAIGETVDLHGPIGGFNITIALSTGHTCAIDIIKDIKENRNECY